MTLADARFRPAYATSTYCPANAAAPSALRTRDKTTHARPLSLDWEEQRRLFQALPGHVARMCLFKVNTGCREQEVCGLRWDWEVQVPELNTSVFIIPGRV